MVRTPNIDSKHTSVVRKGVIDTSKRSDLIWQPWSGNPALQSKGVFARINHTPLGTNARHHVRCSYLARISYGISLQEQERGFAPQSINPPLPGKLPSKIRSPDLSQQIGPSITEPHYYPHQPNEPLSTIVFTPIAKLISNLRFHKTNN